MVNLRIRCTIVFSVFLLIFCSATVVAECDPPCGGCKTCVGCQCECPPGKCCSIVYCPDCHWCIDCECYPWCIAEDCEECEEVYPGHYECEDRCDPYYDCESCDGQGNCKSNCDPDKCEECNGQGDCIVCNGDTSKCCEDGECVGPMCENCHSVSDTLYECGHNITDPNGTPCSTTWCIENVLNSATCDYKGDDWPCRKSRCNTKVVSPEESEVIQYKKNSGSCPGGTVNYVPWKTLYYGCTSCDSFTYDKSCETTGCSGSVTASVGRGKKKQCGGCGY